MKQKKVMCWTLVIVSACAMTMACKGGKRASDRVELARLNEERVFADDLEKAIVLSQVEGLPKTAPEVKLSDDDKRRMLDSLIDKRLLLQEALRKKVLVPVDQAEQLFNRLKDSYPPDDFNRMLEERRITPLEFKQAIRDRLLISRLMKDEVHARIAIRDEELQSYFADHPELHKRPERVRCAQIVQRTEAEIAKVRSQVQAGMPFEEAAARFSIAPEAAKGGDLGWIKRGDMPSVIEDNCFALPAGQLSGVVQSPYAFSEEGQPRSIFHLFKVLERQAEQALNFEQVRDEVESKLREERWTVAEIEFLSKLRKSAQLSVKESVLRSIK